MATKSDVQCRLQGQIKHSLKKWDVSFASKNSESSALRCTGQHSLSGSGCVSGSVILFKPEMKAIEVDSGTAERDN